MWPYETYPEVIRTIIDSAKIAAERVLMSYKNNDFPKSFFRHQEHSVLGFLDKLKAGDFLGKRYIGNNLITNFPFDQENPKTDVCNLFLSIVGCIAGTYDYNSVKKLINSKRSLSIWIKEWSSSFDEKYKVALALGFYLFYDIYYFDEGRSHNPKPGYEKILKGEYGPISPNLHDEIVLLILGYLRQNDEFVKMKDITEDDLISDKNIFAKSLFYLQKGIASYANGDFNKSIENLNIGEYYQNKLKKSQSDILEFDYELLLHLAECGLISQKYGTFDLLETYKKIYPERWSEWYEILSDIYIDGNRIMKSISEGLESTVHFGDRWINFYYNVHRLLFWAQRSGLYKLEYETRKSRIKIFLVSGLAQEEERLLRSALSDSVISNDKKAIKTIARNTYPWSSREDFDSNVDWAFKSIKDGTTFLGVMAFLEEFSDVLNEDQRNKSFNIAKIGLRKGFSHSPEFDWGRPAIRLLTNLIKSENTSKADEYFSFIDKEYMRAFHKRKAVRKKPQVRIPSIRYEIVDSWSMAILNITEDSEYVQKVINNFVKMGRDTIKEKIFNNDSERKAWRSLLLRKEAKMFVEEEISHYRKGEPYLIAPRWFSFKEIFDYLTEEEKSNYFLELINKIRGKDSKIKGIREYKIPTEFRFPMEEPFTDTYELFSEIKRDLKFEWVKAINSWFLDSERNILEIYKGWHSLLRFFTWNTNLHILKDSCPEKLEPSVKYWINGNWVIKKEEKGFFPEFMPTHSLIRLMAYTVGYLLDISKTDITIPYDEIFLRRKGHSIDGGISLALCFGLIATETKDKKFAMENVEFLRGLTFQPSFRIVEQSIYALLWATGGPAKVKANDYLKRLLSDKDKRNRSPIRIQKALDYVEEKLKEKINTRKK